MNYSRVGEVIFLQAYDDCVYFLDVFLGRTYAFTGVLPYVLLLFKGI